jgi:hypothetical protein
MNTITSANTAPTISTGISDLSTSPNDSAHAGNWFAYNAVAGLPEALPLLRSVHTTYRLTEKAKAKGIKPTPNVMVRIPSDHLTIEQIVQNIEILAPYVLNFLQSEEDTYARDSHKAGLTFLPLEQFTLPALCDRLDVAGKGMKVDAAMVTAWYTDHLAPALTRHVAQQAGFDEANPIPEDARANLSKLALSYLPLFVKILTTRTLMQDFEMDTLAKALEIADASSTALGSAVLAKIASAAKEKVNTLHAL